ncbi:hypothetical protein FOS14_08325 [Skermania sp. ID1734]|uniref:hypothetical protein n=1 Tax=Skermania sp. ID1734 TaxID=2597516 RepID=UPI0011810B41|nr:hypothetical protein [Skermania sp. ID1734]TSE00413.1 hypothetical protein FOS14_08325 [Skermania sp. ID1734]
MRELFHLIAWLLPASSVKNRLLRLFGHDIAASARIGPTLALGVEHVVVGERAAISPGNVLRGMRLFDIGEEVTIGSWNTFSAHPGYRVADPNAGCAILDRGSSVTSRHYFDCSGKLHVQEFAVIAGHHTTILTHEIALDRNVQTAGVVMIGARSAVMTNCVMLKGACLPPMSILGANSMLTRSKTELLPGLYGGSPARRIGDMDTGPQSWFARKSSITTELTVDVPMAPHDETSR